MADIIAPNCDACPFKGIRIGSRGNPQAPIVLVGEGPANDEIRVNKLLVGPVGKLLEKCLPAGFTLDDFYIVNAIQCLPKNKTPQAKMAAAKCCQQRLLSEIAQYPRKMVIALGGIALNALTNDFALKITSVRGHKFPFPHSEMGIMATIHPAFVLRGGGNIKHLKQDLEDAITEANGTSTRNYIDPEYRVISSPEGLEKLNRIIRKQQFVGADIETSGFSQFTDRILSIGIGWDPKVTYIVEGENIWKLKEAFEDPNVRWIWHNGKFDIKFMREARCTNGGIRARVDEDTMLLNYCLSPETRILKSDLTWNRIDQLNVGDELIGFDEYNETSLEESSVCTKLGKGKSPGSNFKPSKVLALKHLKAPKYKLCTEQGEVVASAQHMWAAKVYGQSWVKWISTQTLAEIVMRGGKAELLHFVSPWETMQDYKAGYIAGILDGEGCLASGWTGKNGDSNWSLGFSQKPGIVLDTALQYLVDFGYSTNLYKYNREGITRINFKGYRESLRVIGMFRPQRMLEKSEAIWSGTRKCTPAKILNAVFLGEGEVIGIETTTKTIIAEGFKSHNCLDETSNSNDLGSVAIGLLGCPDWKAELDAMKPSKKASYDTIAKPILYSYQAKDVSYMLQSFEILRPRVAADKHCEKLYTKTLIPASEMLANVERRGMLVDEPWRKRQHIRLESEITVLREEINQIVGYSINPNSSAQVCKYVYDTLRIKAKERSTDAKIVANWPDMPFKKALQKYRKVAKALSTYVIGYARFIEPSDGRIHPTFKLHRTPTGRLACSEPNLQNIPRDPQLKGMYHAPEGYVYLEVDYSQAELRSLAVQSGDKELLRIFNTPGLSLHKEVAIARYGKDYTPDQYVRAKAVNFGIAYGREAYSIAEEFGIPVREAQSIIDAWFARFPQAKEFIDKCRGTVVKGQTMITAFGRKKRAKYPSPEMLRNLQNEAANFPHQSTASDCTLQTAIRIQPILVQQWNAYIVDLVHDSMVIECPNNPETIKLVGSYVAAEMQKTPELWGIHGAPFLADVKQSINWGNSADKD